MLASSNGGTVSKELEAKRASLLQLEGLLAKAMSQRAPPWTAVSQMTRQQTRLAAEVAQMEAEEEKSEGITAERLRDAIRRLPPELIEVAEKALAERRRK